MVEKGKKRNKTRVGYVVSDKMHKTVIVSVERLLVHKRYKKRVKRTNRIFAHDKDNQCRVGDKILVMESRPLSRKKRWRVSNIIERAK